MKIALCLSGQSRFVEEGYKSFSTNLIGFENIDIFVHSWEDNEYQKVLDLYNITNHIIEPQRYDITFDDTNIDYSQQDAGSGDFVHYSMFYSIWKTSQLKQMYEETHNFKYDCVIRSRFDVALLDELDVIKQDLSFINSPDVCGNPNVISDWFNFSNSDNMNVYLDVYNNMPQYKSDGVLMTSGEKLFTHHYKKNNLQIKKIACNLCLIRRKDCSSPYWISVTDLRDWIAVDTWEKK